MSIGGRLLRIVWPKIALVHVGGNEIFRLRARSLFGTGWDPPRLAVKGHLGALVGRAGLPGDRGTVFVWLARSLRDCVPIHGVRSVRWSKEAGRSCLTTCTSLSSPSLYMSVNRRRTHAECARILSHCRGHIIGRVRVGVLTRTHRGRLHRGREAGIHSLSVL